MDIDTLICLTNILFKNTLVNSITPLQGGLTNKIFLCVTTQGKYVARIYSNEQREELIKEYNFLRASRNINCIPKLYAFELNSIILEYIEGNPLTNYNLRRLDIQESIALQLSSLHWINNKNDVKKENVLIYHLVRFKQILEKIIEKNNEKINEKTSLETLVLKEISVVILKLSSLENKHLTSNFCHNDLHGGNIIFNSEVNELKFIDFGFTGTNFIMFDIANLFCETLGFDSNSLLNDYVKDPNITNITMEKNKSIILNFINIYCQSSKLVNPCFDANDLTWNNFMFFVNISHFFWGCWALTRQNDCTYDYLQYAANRLSLYQ